MELEDIKHHWENWSKEFKTNLRATTKTSTIKELEIRALYNAIKKTHYTNSEHSEYLEHLEILEVGCGNGYNCYALADLLKNCHFTGVDYVSDMIENARDLYNKNQENSARIRFELGNILTLENNEDLRDDYHIVFTDRCIINLNSIGLQLEAIDQLLAKVKQGGYLLILENFVENFMKQNECRELIGLPKRTLAEFNYFINTESFLSHLKQSMQLVHVDDFGSLHDIILYVLTPMINHGAIDYEHPLVKAASELSIAISTKYENPFGSFGQNRLFLFHKK